MKILVTGAGGFVGKALTSVLLEEGFDVFAGVKNLGSINKKGVKEIIFDILNRGNIERELLNIKPDGIIHLAAQSKVTSSWVNPNDTFLVNVNGTINLINAVERIIPNSKMITVGSSEEYGLAANMGDPLTEEHPCLPQNPYAVSKYAMGQISMQLAKKNNLNIIHVRPFNHFGPGQGRGYVVSDFASQIANIEMFNQSPILKVGNLSAKRDFIDYRDVIDAYVTILKKDIDQGIYNVSSGTARSINEILEYLIRQSETKINVEVDSFRFRPSEVPHFVGSSEKLYNVTGWRPRRNIEDSLLETLEWWRFLNN